MQKYVFNDDYFKNRFMNGKPINYKIDFISQKTGISEASFKNKRSEKRNKDREYSKAFLKSDYEEIKKVDPLLILDTDLLVAKMITRVRLDMKDNVKFVLYYMLSGFAASDKNDRKKWQSINELTARIPDQKYNEKKIKSILESAEVAIDNNGNRRKLFLIYDFGSEAHPDIKYSLDLDNVIRYTDL